MKKTKWLGVMTVWVLPLISAFSEAPEVSNPDQSQMVVPAPSNLSPPATEVLRLAGSGTGEELIRAYIQNSTSPFELSADQILYLRDNGLSTPVITAMLNRDNVLRSQNPSYSYDQKLYAPAGLPPVAPVPMAAPAPEPVAAPPSTPPPTSEASAPTYVSSPPPDVTYFYNDLSPYGTWVDLEGVGWCWQPRVVVVNHTWRPYCDAGHWVYTDAGWFWQSDYSWGWAPFHYGRWQLHPRCGWVWFPDRVWAPSWVVWRSEGDHCGWAPVPPHAVFDVRLGWCFNGVAVGVGFEFGLHPEHFTFISVKDFHQHDFSHYCLPPTQVTKIYNHTTIINNYTINNTTIVNQGIRPERVAAATHTQVRPVHIREVPAGAKSPVESHGGVHSELAVYRPQLKAPAKPVTMVAQKIDDRHPVIQHNTLAPGKLERTSGPGNGNSVPGSGNRNPQLQASKATRPSPESYSKANSYPSAQSAPSVPPPNRSTEQAPRSNTGHHSPPTTVPADPHTPSARPGYTSPSEQNSHQYPLQTKPQAPANSGQSQSQDSVYYPKGYHQAAETHSLPSIHQPQSEGSPTSGNPAHGQSKKSEQ